MAGGQYLTPHQQAIVRRYYGHTEARLGQQLAEAISDLAVETDPKRLGALWQSAHQALKSTPADQMKVGRIVAQRDLKGLALLVEQLSKGKFAAEAKPASDQALPPGATASAGATSAPPPSAVPAPAPPPPTDAHQMNSALAAFKKKIKALRLDEESKLGGRGLTAGRKSFIVAIQPPPQYPPAVWEALVAQRKLRHGGSGLYELVE